MSATTAGPAGARLENYANNPSLSRRKARYDARSGLWKHSTIPRCRKCGRVSRNTGGVVGVRLSDGHAGFSGLVSCGSVWVCPVCSMKIASRRTLEIGTIIAAAAAEGIPAAVCTNTVRHHRGQRLAFVWDGVAIAWDAAISGKYMSAARREYGIEGFIRAQEVTYGVNGFHPHTHSVWIGEGFTDDRAVDDFFEPMWERWSRAAIRAGLDAPNRKGQEWHLLEGDFADTQMAEYLSTAKAFGPTRDTAHRIGMELTQTQSKTATGIYKTTPVWELLTAANWGEVGPAKLWHEFEKASKNRRQINYSRGLRKRFGIEQPEKTDEQIAAEELGTDQDTIVWIGRLGWARLLDLGLVHAPLDIAEQSGQSALCQWLQEHDIDHRRV